MGRKLLIHSIVFSPDGVSTAYLYNDIALRFKKEGYEVVVLTTTPHYNIVESELTKQPLRKKYFGLYKESYFHGIKVKHVPQKKFKSSLLRMLGFVYWHILSFIIGLFERKVDIILSPSPPLTIGVINIWLGKLKKSKVVYNVQEIYPDLLIKEKNLSSTIVIKLLKKIESYVYNKSDAVTTIDKNFADTIVERFRDKSKLNIIPNFVDTDLYKPLTKNEFKIDNDLFPENNSLKLLYAGNIGKAQDWIPLIELAKKIKTADVEFFVIGDGAMKNYLQDEIEKNQLSKIHMIPYQPRHMMPALIAYSDLQFIFMSPHVDGDGFPSKIYTIMACERPLLICAGKNTPIVKFFEKKDCAFVITEKDLNKKVDLMAEFLLSVNKDKLKRMGENGLKEINLYYSKEIVTQQYVLLVDSLF
ncbi:glycosyltransferase family 4 protein [Bacteroidales bacterium OttesenSCG-928-K03]|nr:glycosyltransferase family 4 protein [Odoribacter sp. OttesenSCG-928-L07]MDL2239375.1 glycosyltransferase family 4 protein [Bacteroidales bacterium OttesenSCG-928-L14]MDL2242718.1 glycosyltransferase family 4 protein [Bacteroidales bacterium OttesenSCG-928-K03]